MGDRIELSIVMSDYIPEDNLLVIFKYLPVKTLLRFRCVCKNWKQSIDSPTFAQQHLSVQKPRFILDRHEPNKYLVVDPQPDPLVYNLSKPETENYLLLVGTLHGVVCLYDYKNHLLVLWNPSLRKFLSRPFPSSFRWYKAPLMNSYGFWIDPSTKEFKAIMLQQKPVQKCIMYSSIRDGWSEIPTGKIAKWKPCSEGPPVIVGGAVHWGCCLDSIHERHHRYRYYHSHHTEKAILSFDFVHESFDIMEIPYLQSWEYAPCRWQGSLSVVCWDEDDHTRGCEIYSRQEDSWVKMVSFKVDHHPYIMCVFWAMEDVEGNKEEDVEYLQRTRDLYGEPQGNAKVLAISHKDSGELFLHGTKTGLRVLSKGLKNFAVVMAYDFVESLLFPVCVKR